MRSAFRRRITTVLIVITLITILAACSNVDSAAPVVQTTVVTVAAPGTGGSLPDVEPTPPAPPTPTAVPTTVPTPPADVAFQPGDSLPPDAAAPVEGAAAGGDQEVRELTWEEMVPPGYRPQDIMAKFQDELSRMQDGDPAAMELYARMQEEFMNAPINEELDAQTIKLPGFIAPLEYQDGLITEFLLVPYFGACIHVPPPPPNQTVHIITAEGNAIELKDSYNPIWVSGRLIAEGMTTDIGVAGYRIQEAVITPYTYASP